MNVVLRFSWLAVACALIADLCCTVGCSPLSIVGSGSQSAPSVSNPTIQGTLSVGRLTTIMIEATVEDANGAWLAVVADLSQIGGDSAQPLQQATYQGQYNWTGSVRPASGGLRSVTIKASNAYGFSDSAVVRINVGYGGTSPSGQPGVDGLTRIPLGQSAALSGMDAAMVYVPSRYGGKLSVLGAAVQLVYTDGSNAADQSGQAFQAILNGPVVASGNPCVYTVPEGRGGWYYMFLSQGGPATISTSFIEDGQAAVRPWNGWWWPWNPVAGPTLYDADGPLDRYDRVYGTQSRAWASANEVGGAWWWGHCWGWSIASILLPEPRATSRNGVSFSQDQMKSLYIALADNAPHIDASLSVEDIPSGQPTAASGEDIDAYCGQVHRVVRTCLREDRIAVQADLRAVSTLPDRRDEVWNHAVYRYSASFSQAPGSTDEHLVEVHMQIWANSDLLPPPLDPAADRTEEYVYQLEFDGQGQIVLHSPNQNWISASHYPPHEFHRITGSPWSPRNPYLTKSRIDGLYAR